MMVDELRNGALRFTRNSASSFEKDAEASRASVVNDTEEIDDSLLLVDETSPHCRTLGRCK